MKRDKFLCQDCLERGEITTAEEVHHIQELTPENITDEAITLNLDNLVSLCRKCHKARRRKYDKRYEVDAMGRVTTR